MKTNRIILAFAIILIAGAIWYLQSQNVRVPLGSLGNSSLHSQPVTMNAAEKAKRYERAKEISTPDGFINTDGITIGSLLGKKVILVDFWTYSCINCQRTTPYLNAWYDKYKDQGLEIIGIHTPEFEFEKKYDNVKKAVQQFGIKYPVVLDNDYSTWQAYENRYWPHKYLIDIDGYIVYDHIGEGGYDETEKRIQELLTERMTALNLQGTVNHDIAKPTGAYEPTSGSPETYFGSARNENLGNGTPGTTGSVNFTLPADIVGNDLYLAGTWNILPEYAANASPGAKIVFKYNANKVYIVAGADQPVQVKILVDGKTIAPEQAGDDVVFRNGSAYVTVHDEKLYFLVKGPKGLSGRTLELIIETPGLKTFTFTFG